MTRHQRKAGTGNLDVPRGLLEESQVAESEGFEPSKPAKACQFSRLVYSTALPTLRDQF